MQFEIGRTDLTEAVLNRAMQMKLGGIEEVFAAGKSRDFRALQTARVPISMTNVCYFRWTVSAINNTGNNNQAKGTQLETG